VVETVFNAEFLLLAGGVAMFAHFGLCAWLLRGLENNGPVREALMAIPNRPLGTPRSIRFLRARYYLPWLSLPPGASDLEPRVRGVLLASRLMGFLFAALVTGFFVAIVAEASGYYGGVSSGRVLGSGNPVAAVRHWQKGVNPGSSLVSPLAVIRAVRARPPAC
jgi:hypothetical protein